MPPTPPTTDRRSLLRERHHRAIIDAAAALMRETEGTDFTVEELAERANVSRRTVFNHFATLDDLHIAVCGELLGGLFEQVALGSGSVEGASILDEVAETLRDVELVEPMAYLTRVFGGVQDPPPPRSAVMLLRAFTELSALLARQITERHPEADELHVHLLVGSIASGLIVIHRHWYDATGAVVDEHSHRVWRELLDRLLDKVRHGHAAV
ncbi:TetR/AcrR family transcriptional regulator [Glycomyces harbinensis]|uniref:Transcriptional regulator, TetR family n=1 Tax=Glycomyces harbinensis TaxID=58114 RepID=A0A1G6UDN9_9ACTN|nr:TetR/AcrR family transcriptional regulator [Glycomyces harbinensis]SDD39361.1 transcriptional regulator, TetR family [Glycomyces harbinensis]